MVKNKKGDRRERQLVNELDERGFAVMRAPASGSATERDLPDVLAGNGSVFWAFEAKSSSEQPIYIDGDEIDSLTYFAQNFGAIPRIAARFDYEEWAFFDPRQLYETDGGNRRVKLEDLPDGDRFDDLWNSPVPTDTDTDTRDLP